ncbi:MAG: hypothetical protein WDN66_01940 [Candidatus Saccharibacteria bacterium]
MSRNFWIVVAVIVVLLIGIFAFTTKGNNSSDSKLTATQHVEGLGQATLLLSSMVTTNVHTVVSTTQPLSKLWLLQHSDNFPV